MPIATSRCGFPLGSSASASVANEWMLSVRFAVVFGALVVPPIKGLTRARGKPYPRRLSSAFCSNWNVTGIAWVNGLLWRRM